MKTPSFIVFAFGLTLVIPRVVAQCSSCSSCLSCVVGPPDYLCPTPPTTLEVYAPHESYCTRFYKCINGKAVEGRCPSGTFFNPVQNLCCPDESLCYRANPCVLPVPGCANCANQFVNSEMLASAFFVCNCDGTGVTNQCPMAFDPCTNSTVQLVFTDGNCDPPTEVTTTTTEETTTTTEEETTTTVEETTTTAEETTTTTEEETTTTTEEETTVEE
ncbi:AAEL007112-PA [Aedes aegypti]|uniref:AAEL007112-PA n=1 Tax=Aedes aegypti TaxID=7159 RepID=Q173K7_AEDAE|nr:AAEL007112-PA [Aedes aegypti]